MFGGVSGLVSCLQQLAWALTRACLEMGALGKWCCLDVLVFCYERLYPQLEALEGIGALKLGLWSGFEFFFFFSYAFIVSPLFLCSWRSMFLFSWFSVSGRRIVTVGDAIVTA